MKKAKNYKKIFEKIYASHDFEKLKSFSHPDIWVELNGEEKQLLSLLFVMQGEMQLSKGSGEVLESFRLANQIAPDNPFILYRQGMAFSKQTSNQFALSTACKFFQSATLLKPDFFDAWHRFANTLVILATLKQDNESLLKCLEKFEIAERLCHTVSKERRSYFYYDFGMFWYTSGKVSGEPKDFFISIRMYQKALSLGASTAHFWNDFGNAIQESAYLLNRPEWVVEAVEMYWLSTKLSPSFSTGWYNLAIALKNLYQLNLQEAYYVFASESFQKLVQLDPVDYKVWFHWGQLKACKGKFSRDFALVKESLKKFEVADFCEPENPMVLEAWADAEASLGAWTDDYAKLNGALKKIFKSLQKQKDRVSGWHLLGTCLNSLGQYFNDESYFLEAIEKFKLGLKLQQEPCLLHGLALSYFTLGQIRDDVELVQEASRYYQKVCSCSGKKIPQLWNEWGLALLKLGNMTEKTHYLLGSIQKFEKAMSLYLNSGVQQNQSTECLYNLGSAYECLGDCEDSVSYLEKAKQLFKKVLEIEPNYYAAYYNLGCVFCRLGELMQELNCFFAAHTYFQKAVAYDPEDDGAWLEWGILFIQIAELIKDPMNREEIEEYYKEAEKKLLQAAGLGNLSALYHLGCLFSLVNNCDLAMFFLEKCYDYQHLPSTDELLMDDWLHNVRSSAAFEQFLSRWEEIERGWS